MARVLMFGRLADIAGWRERVVAAPSLDALTAALTAADPALGEALRAPGVKAAVDHLLAAGDVALDDDGSEVAFLPPMSGG